MKEALHYTSVDGKGVRCLLCPHECVIEDGDTGICGTRKNEGGRLYALVYDRMVSVRLDPMEKKPLYHFYPGSQILSLGTAGCSFRCRFCQNFEISQSSIDDLPSTLLPPASAVKVARQYESVGIAYTYNEPLVNFEYILETASLAKREGLKNVAVTNGFINETPLKELLPYMDAANVDVKSLSRSFYSRYCGGRLNDVLRTVEILQEGGKHVEITNLVIPSLNDSEEELGRLVDWVASLSDKIPLHFSRYYPCYKMDIPATPLATLKTAKRIAGKKLKFVYLGNVPEEERSDTVCPDCGRALIERRGYDIRIVGLEGKKCANCGSRADIER